MASAAGPTYDRGPPYVVTSFQIPEESHHAYTIALQRAAAETAMKIPLYDNKNIMSGIFFIGVGALGIYMAQDYPMGTALRMGPGYFPIVLSGMLILFGSCRRIQGLLHPEKLPGNWSPRAFLILPIATKRLRLLMDHAGFIRVRVPLVYALLH